MPETSSAQRVRRFRLISGICLAAALVGCGVPDRRFDISSNGFGPNGYNREGERAAAILGLSANKYEYADSGLPQARALFNAAIEPITEETPGYLENRYFQIRGSVLANLAYSYILAGNSDTARIYYERAFQTINKGENNLEERIKRNQQLREQATEALMLLTSVALTTSALRAGSTSVNRIASYNTFSAYRSIATQIPAITRNLPSSSTQLVSRHTSQLGPTSDSIRMPVLPTTLSVFSNIGKVETSGGGTCTGVLVEFRIVATNAHCVTSTNSGGRTVNSPRNFVLEDAFFVKQIPVERVVLHQGDTWDGATQNDWALLVLPYHPDGHLYHRPEGQGNQYPIGSKLMISGYSGDLNEGRYQTLDFGCGLAWTPPTSSGATVGPLQSQSYVGASTNGYRCRTAPGSSGSPVWVIPTRQNSTSPKPILIGLHAVRFGNSDGIGAGPDASQFRERVETLAQEVNLSRPQDPFGKMEWENVNRRQGLEHMRLRLSQN